MISTEFNDKQFAVPMPVSRNFKLVNAASTNKFVLSGRSDGKLIETSKVKD